jgi:hypothetical protein
MKLSAAIRIGSMTTKQIIGLAHDGGNGRCAIGAALDAAGEQPAKRPESNGNFMPMWSLRLRQLFPIARVTLGDMDVCQTIWHMNDSGRFTREQIADWVETIEAYHPALANWNETPGVVSPQKQEVIA